MKLEMSDKQSKIIKLNNNIKPRVCHDVIFKSIFSREESTLFKMVYDITSFYEFKSIKEILPGYELTVYQKNGKVNRSDMLLKGDGDCYLNLEINYRHEKNVIYRNSIQLYRILTQLIESGTTDKELAVKKVCQLNFNTFSNSKGQILQKIVNYVDSKTKEVIHDIITFWNLDIVKSYKKVYNNIENVQNLPKAVRWGAILYSEIYDLEKIDKIIGDDLLSKEEKESFMSRIKDIGNDKSIIQEWMVIENNRLKEQGILNTAKEEGREELIMNMINKGLDYNIISEISGKTVKEIKDIENNLANVY